MPAGKTRFEKNRKSRQKRSLGYRRPATPYFCSTLLDLEAERDLLEKTIFPQLNRLCQTQGSSFTPVDLQWFDEEGVSGSSNVLSLCLDYVARCSPFFICVLGDRYSSHRDENAPPLTPHGQDLSREASWLDRNLVTAANNGHGWVLQEHNQKSSILELLITQAAFLNEDNGQCYFYFRESAHVDLLYQDLPLDERREKLEVFFSESEYEKQRVEALKQKIAKKGLPTRYFKTPEELGRLLIEDWGNVIDLLYPEVKNVSTDLANDHFLEWTTHEAFAESRRSCFLPTIQVQSLFDQLTTFALTALDKPPPKTNTTSQSSITLYKKYSTLPNQSKSLEEEEEERSSSVLVMVGERGCGKTSLLSNWAKEFQQSYGQELTLLTHYVGSSPASTDIATFLKRTTIEMRQEYSGDLAEVYPQTTEDLSNFQNVCQAFLAAASMGPCVLVVDGMDELSGTFGLSSQQVKELSWLPSPLPPQCKIIVTSVNSDLTFKALSGRRDTQTVRMKLVGDKHDRRTILEYHLGTHSQRVTEKQVEQVLKAHLSDRPLFLAALAGELRLVRDPARLDALLEQYLETKTVGDLWERIITRWTREYGWASPQDEARKALHMAKHEGMVGWVADILRLVAVSRCGPTQADLLSILPLMGYLGRPAAVSTFDLATFFLATHNSFFTRPGGHLAFFHHHLKQAVEQVLLGVVGNEGDLSSQIPSSPSLAVAPPWDKVKVECHRCLATYFRRFPHGARRTQELPWQLEMCRDYGGLCGVLAEPRLFLSMNSWESHKEDMSLKLDLLRYWKLLCSKGYRADTTYSTLTEQAMTNQAPVPPPGNANDQQHHGGHSQDDYDDDVFTNGTPTDNLESIHEKPSGLYAGGLGTLQGIVEGSELAPSQASDLSAWVASQGAPSYGRHPHDHDDLDDSDHLAADYQHAMEQALYPDDPMEEEVMPFDSADQEPLAKLEVASLAYHAGTLLVDLGQAHQAHQFYYRTWQYLKQKYPLSRDEFVLLCKTEERQADWHLSQERSEVAEKYYNKALDSLYDIPEDDDDDDGEVASDSDSDSHHSAGSGWDDDVSGFSYHWETKGRILSKLGHLKMMENDLEEAAELLKEAEECLNATNCTTTKSLLHFHTGILCVKKKEFSKAERYLRKALKSRELWYGSSHPLVADVLDSLAGLLSDQLNINGYDKNVAEYMYRRALDIRRQCMGAKHLIVGTTLFHLGSMLKADGSHHRKMEGRELLQHALDIGITQLGPDHPNTKALAQALKEVERQLKNGEYDFAPVKKQPDKRTKDQPYSNLSWHDYDLMVFDQRAKVKTAQVARQEAGGGQQQRSSVGPAGNGPAGGEKSSVEVRIEMVGSRNKSAATTAASSSRTVGHHYANSDDGLLKPAAEDCPPTHRSTAKPPSLARSGGRDEDGQGQGAARSAHSAASRSTYLHHYGGPALLCPPSSLGPPRSAHRSRCQIPGPHQVNSSGSQLYGPNSSLQSLLGDPPAPRHLALGLVHKSAWFHVPGRYITLEQPLPPRRFDVRKSARSLPDLSLARQQRASASQREATAEFVGRDLEVTGHYPFARKDSGGLSSPPPPPPKQQQQDKPRRFGSANRPAASKNVMSAPPNTESVTSRVHLLEENSSVLSKASLLE